MGAMAEWIKFRISQFSEAINMKKWFQSNFLMPFSNSFLVFVICLLSYIARPSQLVETHRQNPGNQEKCN